MAPYSSQNTFELDRFVTAQKPVYERVLRELRAGQKQSHWMWFIFPQIHGLGRSSTAVRYALRSLAEAGAYLAHPLLGARLVECTKLVLAIHGRTLNEIFGFPDELKFHSSMTLFSRVVGDSSVFEEALGRYCNGENDLQTLERL